MDTLVWILTIQTRSCHPWPPASEISKHFVFCFVGNNSRRHAKKPAEAGNYSTRQRKRFSGKIDERSSLRPQFRAACTAAIRWPGPDGSFGKSGIEFIGINSEIKIRAGRKLQRNLPEDESVPNDATREDDASFRLCTSGRRFIWTCPQLPAVSDGLFYHVISGFSAE